MLSQEALIKIIEIKKIKTLFDIGCGKGNHSNIFNSSGIEVTALDLGIKDKNIEDKVKYYQGHIEDFNIKLNKFDCVWSSHCLEHSLNPQLF